MEEGQRALQGVPEPRRPEVEQPPARVVGCAQLARWLRKIGITITEAHLLQRSCLEGVEGVPVERRGKRFSFTREHMRQWVEDLTGRPYEEWMARWEASDKKHPLIWRRPKHALGPDSPPELCALTIARGGVEAPMRASDGTVFLTFDLGVRKRWPSEARANAHALVALSTTRPAGDIDFAKPESARLEELVAPRLMREGELRYISVDGRLFGLDAGTETPLVAPAGWPKWKPLRAKIDRIYPDALWTVWGGRRDLDPFLMVPVVSPEAPAGPGNPPA